MPALAKTWWGTLLLVLLTALPLMAGTARAQFPVTTTDLAGRQVTVPRPPRAVLLGEGLQLVALSLVHPDPVSLLAGWPGDMARFEPRLYEEFRTRFPALARVPVVGSTSGDNISLERAIAVRPDLAVVSAWQYNTDTGRRLADQLTAIGVPVVVIDFFLHPLRNTAPSLRLLGRVLGRAEQGDAVADFHAEHLDRLRRGAARATTPGPVVLLHAYPGTWDCCWSAGATGMGEFLALVGGRNLGAEVLPSSGGGPLSPEFVAAANPQVYVATGLPQRGEAGTLSIGPGIAPDAARRSLEDVVARLPALAATPALRDRRVHGLWNFFNGVPLNILAAEALARWVRPDLFPDLDPAATLQEINTRFAAMPFRGSFWISLEPAPR